MSTRSDDVTLLDLEAACRDLIDFPGTAGQETFLADRKTQAAIRHQLLIIGEATKRLSRSFRDRNASVPWRAMTGMRDTLIHGYDTVNLIEMWLTATEDVPRLLTILESVRPLSRDDP